MTIVAKVAAAVVILIVLLLVIVRITGFNPIGNTPGPGNYPGFWLSGTVVKAPSDWSFTNEYQTDKVQTHTWYMIPHSVTTAFIVYQGQLYLTSNFAPGRPFPQGKSWVANVMRDPRVRLKFGNNLYECVLSHITDPQERATVLGSKGMPAQPLVLTGSNVAVMHLFHAMCE